MNTNIYGKFQICISVPLKRATFFKFKGIMVCTTKGYSLTKTRAHLGFSVIGAKYRQPPWLETKDFFLSNLLKHSKITLICDKSGDDIMEFHRDFCMLLRLKSILNDSIKISDGAIIFITVMKEVY